MLRVSFFGIILRDPFMSGAQAQQTSLATQTASFGRGKLSDKLRYHIHINRSPRSALWPGLCAAHWIRRTATRIRVPPAIGVIYTQGDGEGSGTFAGNLTISVSLGSWLTSRNMGGRALDGHFVKGRPGHLIGTVRHWQSMTDFLPFT